VGRSREFGLRGIHWGALLFTAIVGVGAFALARPLLTAPLPSAPAFAAPGDEPQLLDVPTPIPAALHSRWYTQTVSPVIDVGETGNVTLQFRNVGQTAWILGSPSEIRLGEIGPRPLPTEMKVDWPLPNRPAIQTELVVHVDQVATFTFKVVGVTPGVFRLMLRPVVDGVAWLEDEGVFIDINVR
jgi:hypothetical protein